MVYDDTPEPVSTPSPRRASRKHMRRRLYMQDFLRHYERLGVIRKAAERAGLDHNRPRRWEREGQADDAHPDLVWFAAQMAVLRATVMANRPRKGPRPGWFGLE